MKKKTKYILLGAYTVGKYQAEIGRKLEVCSRMRQETSNKQDIEGVECGLLSLSFMTRDVPPIHQQSLHDKGSTDLYIV